MKILFISAEYPPETGGGGIGSYVASIVPALADLGHEVHVLSCVKGQKPRDYLDSGVHIHRRDQPTILPLKVLRALLRIPLTVSRIAAGISTFIEAQRLCVEFDVVEYPDWSAEGWLFGLTRRYPSIAHLHTPLPIIAEQNGIPPSIDLRISSMLERYAVECADIVSSPSHLLVSTLKEIDWLKSSVIRFVRYPIDWHRWNSTKRSTNMNPTALFVGRIEKRKAPELLIEALEIIREDVPDATGVFIGSSNGTREGISYLDWIKSLPSASSSAFVSQIPRHELPDHFLSARVFVLPSRFDNYPVAVLEAMAAGLPVVVSDRVGCSELLKKADVGRVFQSGSSRALAEAVKPFLQDPEYSLECGQRARALVQQCNDPVKLAEDRVSIFKEAMNDFAKRKQRSPSVSSIPARVGSFKVPDQWREWATEEAMREPWRHYYPRAALHLLELIAMHSRFKKRTSLLGLRILDAGCTPAISVLLALMGADVVMVDLNSEELTKGLSYARQFNCEHRLTAVLSDVFYMPFHKESFDIVWNNGFVEHFDTPEDIIREMSYHTKPSGAVIVLVPNTATPHSIFIREALRRRPKGYYWDFMGIERSYSPKQLVTILQQCNLNTYGISARNLRRSILDDSVVLPVISRMFSNPMLMRFFRIFDHIEETIPLTRTLGFMVGAGGIKVEPTQARRSSY